MKAFKKFALIAGIALSLSLFGACGATPADDTLSYNGGVAKAFRAVVPEGELISQTATAEEDAYLVTVITPSSVSAYRVRSDFTVGSVDAIIGEAPSAAALAAEEAVSDLERAYSKALSLSGIAKADVEGFDFDRDTYMGKAVLKVEIEDAAAEYTYTFDAADLTLLASKTELKTAKTAPSSYLGEAKAKAIALDAAGIPEDAAAGFTVKMLPENGRKLYRASFDFEGFRYTVDIDALNGEIMKLSKELLDESVVYPEIPQTISEEEARAIALAVAFPEGINADMVRFEKVKLDYERGQFVYEVEFVAGGIEYEFEIAAKGGAVLDMEIDGEETPAPSEAFLTREQAVAKVLEQAGEDAFILEVDIEKETVGGVKRYYYEIEVRAGGREAEYYVDAVTGEVTLNKGYAGNPADPNPTVSQEEALAIALENFGLTADMVTAKKVELEREDGRLCWEIKLFAGTGEYKMSIDARTGEVFEREIDLEHGEHMPPAAEGTLTAEQAADAVRAYFEGRAETVRIGSVEWEDEGTGAQRRYFYEVEAVADGKKYECYVDVTTGEVRVKGELMGSGKTLIGEEKALSIALERYSLSASEIRVVKVKLEEDDGILIYEVEFKVNDLEYTFEIDAETGTILDIDISYD